MLKLALTATVALLAFSASAMAAGKSWNVTEESAVGVKNAQGVWLVTVDGDKITGSAELQLTNGTELTYTVKGTIADGVYTIAMENRSDDKKGCVWTAHAPAAGKVQTSGLIGDASCQGSKMVLRAGF